MNIQSISKVMMNVAQVGTSEQAKVAYALSGLAIAAVATGYTVQKQIVRPARLALTNYAQNQGEMKWKSYALAGCNFLVGRQAKPTKVVPLTVNGAVNFLLQSVDEAVTNIQEETYKEHAAKFERKEFDPENKTLLKKFVGNHEAIEKVEEKVNYVENEVASYAAYGYKQAASHFLVPVAEQGIKYFASEETRKQMEETQDKSRLGKVGSDLVEGAQVKAKKAIADWIEQYVDNGATWAGHATADTLKVALIDTLTVHLGNHQLVRGGAAVTEILNSENIPEGISRLLSIGVREATHSPLAASAAYLGGRIGFLAGELLIRAYQNQLMLEAEEEVSEPLKAIDDDELPPLEEISVATTEKTEDIALSLELPEDLPSLEEIPVATTEKTTDQQEDLGQFWM